MKQLFYILIAASSLLLAACEKNAITLPVDPATGGARLKLVNAAPDLPGGIELAINGTKVSAFTPSGVTTASSGFAVGLPFNATFPNVSSNYAVVAPGAVTLSLTSPATTTATSATAIGQQQATLDDNTYYSLLVTGTGPQPDRVLLKDDFSQATSSSRFYVRFVNLIPNAPTNYDLLLADGKTVVASNIGYKTATAFLPFDVSQNAALVLRATGTTINVGAYTFSSLANGRVLTLYAAGVFGRTGATAPLLNGYVNR